MNVYDQIDANRRKTAAILCAFPASLFVLLFLLCLPFVKTGLPMYLQTGFLHMSQTGALFSRDAGEGDALRALEDRRSTILLWNTEARSASYAFRLTLMIYPWMVLTAFLWIVFSYYKGGGMILTAALARPAAADRNRDLFRLVENTAIMAGLPTPGIYLIQDEALNAFSTGLTPETASIALTKGIVEKLSKSELQAVIAHELAHIGNRDTRLMTITVAGIGCFTFFGELLLGARRRNRRGIALLSFIVGSCCLIFGYVVAPILRFALSRRREYQADATAVKIVRDPEALARALEKTATDPGAGVLSASSMLGNLCIVNPVWDARGFMSLARSLYAAHPPLEDRLRALKKMTGGETPRKTAGRVIY